MVTRVLWRSTFAMAALLLAPGVLAAQDRQIAGRVTRAGADPQPLDAEVSVVGQLRYRTARTNPEGRYTITAPQGEVRLMFRAIGYGRVEVVVPANQGTLDVQMEQDVFKLSEVVVTGQATSVERRSATTAIAYVSGEDLSKVSAPTIENALVGKITGVNLQSNSGAPGGGIQMQIRGNNTILGAFDPLYVIDGVIYSNARVLSGRSTVNAGAFASEDDAVNRVADINPTDIASIEILKGAAASSIYGSKASNGVVVITTIRGTAGRPRANISQRFGMFSPLRQLEGRRWTKTEAADAYGQAIADKYFGSNESVYFDHYDQVFSQRNLSYETVGDVSGGSETTRYFITGTWKRDEGIEPNTGFSRQSIRANIDQTLSSKVEVKVSSVYNRAEHARGWNNNCNNFGCHGYALAYTPSFVNLEARNPDGTFPDPDWGIQSNPIQTTELARNQEQTNRFTGGINAIWQAVQSDRHSFKLVGGVGLDVFNQNNDIWTPNELFWERNQAEPGVALEGNADSKYYNWNVNGVHVFATGTWSATTSLGFQFEDRRLKTARATTTNLIPGQQNVGQGTTTTSFETLTEERTLALYAQEEVRLLDDRLLLQGGLRAERSSVNGDIDKYFVFPKLSGSYRFTDVLGAGSEIKLRAAYGETGNQPLFGQKFTNLNTPQFGQANGFTVAGAAGFPGVEPERLKEWEAGIDGAARDGRLTWDATYFRRSTTNLLLQRVPAPSTGFTSQIFNGGEIENQGFELGLGYTPIQNRNLQWVARGTFTSYTSEVVDLAGLPSFRPPLSGFGGLGVTFVEVGQPLTQIIGREYYADGDSVSSINVQIGNSNPDFRVGFVNDITYKSLNVSFVLDWQQGGSVIDLTTFLYDDASNAADYGEPTWENRYNNCYLRGAMTCYIADATFLKLREVNIGVDLPKSWVQSLGWGVDNVRLSLSGRNLLTFQSYDGLDPEVANVGAAAIRNNLDVAPYPPSRAVFFSVGVAF
ncbi:MAG TPA: SusC/RagA family TonB-linked outer membrane protein [Gemmatimonadales bacterium]|nr:SusC/RagA family TonB-linked outer membrane protein [Gemmatimonadales bacterium]